MSQVIRIRVEGGVLTITFHRLERKNPVAAVMYGEVTAVCGPPIDIGTARLLRCDLVQVGDSTMFSIGHHQVAAALLLGEPLNPQAALAADLVNKILPAAEVNSLAQQQAKRPKSCLGLTTRVRVSSACSGSRQQRKPSLPSWQSASPISPLRDGGDRT
jgi:enoyl-CoA hydratase/carnithine racemase